MNKFQPKPILFRVIAAALIFSGILVRIYLLFKLDYKSIDMVGWLVPWYDHIESQGILKALGENFSNYTPPYTYLLSLMILMPIPKVMAIKLPSVIMDLANAFMIFKIVQFQFRSKWISLLAAGIFLCLPTIFINSTIWGQADAIYTGFLLASLYFLLKAQPFWGMLMFSISFGFKAQAIFMMPFLIILCIKKRIKLWHFLLIPVIYIIVSLPVILLGRSWIDVLTIFLQQGNTYKWLSANAPNLYILIPNDYYQPGVRIGLAAASICLILWIFFTARYDQLLDNKKLVQFALLSVAISPFLLPKMHDRYFYPADIFSLVLAFYLPEIWFLPVIYQIISGLSYMPFLLGAGYLPLAIATSVNTTALIYLLRRQFHNVNCSRSQAADE